MKTETAWQLITDDCLNALPTIKESSIDACVTDPPYGLEFMGQNWDYGVPGVAYWKEVLRVLKPGAPLLAFGGTRTHHRLMTAIEDAGFELRDCLCWLFGSGFPKSLNISKAIDKAAGAERKITGADPDAAKRNKTTSKFSNLYGNINDKMSCPITAPATAEAKLWDGWGSALKPAYEPIILAMKPLDGTYAHNALTHGVAGLNIDGCRIPLNGEPSKSEARRKSTFGGRLNEKAGVSNALGKINRRGDPAVYAANHGGDKGRWPANVILDEEAGKLLDEQTDNVRSPHGGASRFFYVAKASRKERTCDGTVDNRHATVKPLALMQWLCRLVSTPTGGTILDPFAGSGSTGIAAMKEGLNFIGIEKEEAYAEIARKRLAAAQPVPRHRQASLFDLIGGLD